MVKGDDMAVHKAVGEAVSAIAGIVGVVSALIIFVKFLLPLAVIISLSIIGVDFSQKKPQTKNVHRTLEVNVVKSVLHVEQKPTPQHEVTYHHVEKGPELREVRLKRHKKKTKKARKAYRIGGTKIEFSDKPGLEGFKVE